MKAGRELDALIAEKVMGWEYHDWRTSTAFEKTKYCVICGCTKRLHAHVEIDDFCGTEEKPPHYSTQIADAWLVVEKLELTVGPEYTGGWYAGIPWKTSAGKAPTAPLAICLAALEEVGE